MTKYKLLKSLPGHEVGEVWNLYDRSKKEIEIDGKIFVKHCWEYGFFLESWYSDDWFEKVSDKPEKMIELSNGKKVSELSDCCKAPVKLNKPNARRGETIYYICTKCDQPCDLIKN